MNNQFCSFLKPMFVFLFMFSFRLYSGNPVKKTCIMSTQYIRDYVENSVLGCKKSKRWKEFVTILSSHASVSSEIVSEATFLTLLHELMIKANCFRSNTLAYKIFNTVIDLLYTRLNIRCSICLEKPNRGLFLACCKSSFFCKKCLASWYVRSMSLVDSHSKCPLCRKVFTVNIKKSLNRDYFFKKKRKQFLVNHEHERRRQERENQLAAIHVHNALNNQDIIDSGAYTMQDEEVGEGDFDDPFFSDNHEEGYDLSSYHSRESDSDSDPFIILARLVED